MKTYLGRVVYPSSLPDDVTLWKHPIALDEAKRILQNGVIPYATIGDRYIVNWVQELFDLSLPVIRQPASISLRRTDRILIPQGAQQTLRFSVVEIMNERSWLL